MIIDEKKVIAKSKSYSKGFKGIIPTAERGKFKKNNNLHTLRIAIGIMVGLSFASGLLALIYTLVTEGGTAVQRLADEQNAKPQYIEVIYKPQQNK